MRYRCKKLTDHAWSKAFEIGQEYECIALDFNGGVGNRELTLKSGNSDYVVPYDCFDVVDISEVPPTEQLAKENPLDVQVGGNHYKDMEIQPIDFILKNKLGYCEANVVKYISRWKDKNGVEDLKKAKHYIEILIKDNEIH